MIRKYWRWLSALIRWFLGKGHFWFPIVLVLLVIFIGSRLPGKEDDHVRYCGLILQLLGILVVVYSLGNRRRLFKRPSFIDELRRWLSRRPRLGAKPHTFSYVGTGGVRIGGSAKVFFWRGVPPGASLEDRLTTLEANVENLKTEQAETAKELQAAMEKLTEAINSERQMQESIVKELREQFNELGAGGLHIEIAGVFWLILGVVLSTIPSEVVDVARWSHLF